jgi:hypothetical protein
VAQTRVFKHVEPTLEFNVLLWGEERRFGTLEWWMQVKFSLTSFDFKRYENYWKRLLVKFYFCE